MKQLRRAFTLIELLVVIAIIAILAAILVPVFMQAKLNAMQTMCLTHMKQLGTALQLYLQDHDELWCPGGSENKDPKWKYSTDQMWIGYDNHNGVYGGGEFDGQMWNPAINPIRPGMVDVYLKSNAVKKCPVQPKDWQLSVAYAFFNSLLDQDVPSSFFSKYPGAKDNEYSVSCEVICGDPYVPNNDRLPCGQNWYDMIGANDADIQDPANTLVLWEHYSWAALCDFMQPYDWTYPPPHNTDLLNHFHFLHRNGANTVWADMHAKRFVYGALHRSYFTVRKDVFPP